MRFCIGILILAFGFTATANAEEQSFLECKIKEVLVDDYENINDFTFADYPWLVVSPAKGGWKVSVGAMIYGEDEEILPPEEIRSMWMSPAQLKFYTRKSDEKWIVIVNLENKEAAFWIYEPRKDTSLKAVKVATFSCELGATK